MITKSLISIVAILMIATLSYGQMYTVSATAVGANEVPPVTSMGSASVTGTYDEMTNMITVTVNYSNLSSGLAAAHFHAGVVGANGPVIVNLAPPTGATSGTFGGTFAVPAVNEADLLAGNFYINLHTPNNPGGELRDQLNLLPVPPVVAAIPTMGQWGLMVLGLSVMILGIISIRQKQLAINIA